VRGGRLRVPWATFFKKGISVTMGRDDDDERWNRAARLITTGAAKPSQIVSHRLFLEAATDAYADSTCAQTATSKWC